MTCGQLRDLGEVAHAPLRVLSSQPSVELLIALSVVTAIDLVRAIEIEAPPDRRVRSAPLTKPLQAAQGVMWIMLMHSSASAR